MDKKPKATYDNFKDEMLNYDLDKHTIEVDVMYKTSQFIQTITAKSMTANFNPLLVKYGFVVQDFPNGTPITTEHLMSVILYTDFTQLSSQFTSTFRRKNPFESPKQVKQRNYKYWWWSKRLKQIINAYGQNRRDGGLEGPFYAGMSVVMTLPRFSIPLFSPTSTSVQLPVAMNFCGDSGMMLEFNNLEGIATRIPGFDVSWLSRFKEEDERYELLCLVHFYYIIFCAMYLESFIKLLGILLSIYLP